MSSRFNKIRDELLSLRQHIDYFDDDLEISTDKHDMWSIKKLLILRYYVPAFLTIIRKYEYETIHYVDLFAGSGFLKIKEKLMPGTPLVPLLTTKEIATDKNNLFFDEYHLSDTNKKYVDALQARTSILKADMPTKIIVKQQEFQEAVEEIFPETPPTWKESKKNAYLVMLDPYGFDVTWEHLCRILRSGAVDVIIYFPTRMISWNQLKDQSAEKLTKMYGNNDWAVFTTENEFVEKYCKNIEEIPVSWRPMKTKTFEVNAGKTKYHLICVSRSKGALRIFSDMKDLFDAVNVKLIESVFDTSVLSEPGLEQFF